MLIAEDLLLLLTDDTTGKLAIPSNRTDLALGGALLVDLTLARRIQITDVGRLLVLDRRRTSDALLDDALDAVDRRDGRKPKDVIRPLATGLRSRLYRRLADRGLVREHDGKLLAVFPTHTWPAGDAEHETAVRTQLTEALRTGATDDVQSGALIALLYALDGVTRVFDPATVGIAADEMKANAERIAEGDWASDAVRIAIRELLAAIIAATVSTATAGSA